MKFNRAILCLPIIGLTACSMIEATKESKDVALVKPFNISDCQNKGTTNVTVTHKVGIITRDSEAVTEELVTVAKNRAAELGGDSIVAKGPAVEGKMSFDIYKCAR